MPGIFPETLSAGALEYRDLAGNSLNPPNVERTYSPLPPFIANCAFTALPSDCNARIEPRQINAIVSELVSFAERMDPTGSWNCQSLQNLAAAFSTWAALNMSVIYVGDMPPANPDPDHLWWESDTGMLFLWYNDGSSTQWVQINAVNKSLMDQISIIGTGEPGDPHSVGLVDCGSY